tara:strand:- start:964 stop:1992 length:1029 start_codon:yes stop_codon:yes gene_type:complete
MSNITLSFVQWRGIVEGLKKPWEDEWVDIDLSYWHKTYRKRPGRPTLAARWGWNEKRVRNRVRLYDGPVRGQNGANTGPEIPRIGKVEPLPDVNTGQKGARKGPDKDGYLTNLYINTPKGVVKNKRVQEVWDFRKEWHPRQSKKPNRQAASLINARVKESGIDAVKAVISWIEEAPETKWWRENKRTGIGTIMKADKWEDRYEQAMSWKRSTPPKLRVVEEFDPHKEWLEVAIDKVLSVPVEPSYMQLWKDVLAGMQDRIGVQDVEIWLASSRVVCVDESSVKLEVANQYYESWIADNYADDLLEVTSTILGEERVYTYETRDGKARALIDNWVRTNVDPTA